MNKSRHTNESRINESRQTNESRHTHESRMHESRQANESHTNESHHTHATEQLVELFVVANGELDMARDNACLLVVARGISRQF